MIIRIPLGDIKRAQVVFTGGKRMDEWYREQDDKPEFMINGSLFTGPQKPVGTVIYDGKMKNDAGWGWGFGSCPRGPAFGGPWDEAWDSYLTGYPGTVRRGVFCPCGGYDPSVTDRPAPRSMIAGSGDELWLVSEFGTVDGISRRLLKMGAENVINLDGGGSSRLYEYGRAVNRPTDDRAIPDLIAIWTGEKKMKGIAKKRMCVYSASGEEEAGRFIDKGDMCLFGDITPNLLIEVSYPVKDGRRRAYVRSLENFTRA